jgi:hypothetical protein
LVFCPRTKYLFTQGTLLPEEFQPIQDIGPGGVIPTPDKDYKSICITSLGVGSVLASIKE